MAEVLRPVAGPILAAAHPAAVDLLLLDDVLDEGDRALGGLEEPGGGLLAVLLGPAGGAALAADRDLTAVASAGAPADGVGLEDGDGGPALGEGARRREAGEPAADDGDVDGVGQRRVGRRLLGLALALDLPEDLLDHRAPPVARIRAGRVCDRDRRADAPRSLRQMLSLAGAAQKGPAKAAGRGLPEEGERGRSTSAGPATGRAAPRSDAPRRTASSAARGRSRRRG